MKNASYSEQLTELMASRLSTPRPRQFGFEYEFMPERPLHPKDLDGVQQILKELGYKEEPGLFRGLDHYITFEPGGQIEFCSVPVPATDEDTVHSILRRTESIIGEVGKRLGFTYIPTGFIPGRGSAPMLLDKPRYHNLHRLLETTGTRGHEMMKGTAAIHFHVALLSIEELPRVWTAVCELSQSPGFAMGHQRRDIWNNTDPSRCGLLCRGDKIPSTDHWEFLRRMVDFGMGALDLGTGLPFGELPNKSFTEFLDHLTTLFTDVRINMKGITLELRTLDSGPSAYFLDKWRQFLDIMRQCLDSQQIDAKGTC